MTDVVTRIDPLGSDRCRPALGYPATRPAVGRHPGPASMAPNCSTPWNGSAPFRADCGTNRLNVSRELSSLLQNMDLGFAVQVVRAFTVYFHLANIIEQVHRVEDLNVEGHTPEQGIEECLIGLVETGISPNEVVTLLNRVTLKPVFTAHPTEATRRTILEKLTEIAQATASTGQSPGLPGRPRKDRPEGRRVDRSHLADRRDPEPTTYAHRRGSLRAPLPGTDDPRGGTGVAG